MSSFINYVSNQSEYFQKLNQIKLDDENFLVGFPIVFNYIPDENSTTIIPVNGFYALNPKEHNSSSEMYLDLNVFRNKNINNEILEEISNFFDDTRQAIAVEIQKVNPKSIETLNQLCLVAKQNQVNSPVRLLLDSLIKQNEKPVLLAGLPGYGKSAVIKTLFNDLKKMNTQQLSQKYPITEEQARAIKQYQHNTMIPINEESTYTELMGRLALTTNPDGQQTTSFQNGILLSALKQIYYNNAGGIIGFDELLDNPTLITNFKSSLMPDSNGNYNFVATTTRDFLVISCDKAITINNLDENVITSKIACFEIGKDCDSVYNASNKSIEIKNGEIIIDANALTPNLKHNLTRLLPPLHIRERLKNNPQQIELIKSDYFEKIRDMILKGTVPFLISRKKANEILQASGIVAQESNIEIPFVINKNKLKISATGNAIQGISAAAEDRFYIHTIEDISYKELLNNLAVHRFGIDSELFKKLDAIDTNLVNVTTKAIIDLVKNIRERQELGEYSTPDHDMQLDNYHPEKLNSVGLNPRLITTIINNASHPQDLVDGFKKHSRQILGIKGFADAQAQEEINMYQQQVDIALGEPLKKIFAKYPEFSITEHKNELFLGELAKIDSLDNQFEQILMKKESLELDEIEVDEDIDENVSVSRKMRR